MHLLRTLVLDLVQVVSLVPSPNACPLYATCMYKYKFLLRSIAAVPLTALAVWLVQDRAFIDHTQKEEILARVRVTMPTMVMRMARVRVTMPPGDMLKGRSLT